MDTVPEVSVIMTTFQRHKRLDKAIKSVHKQFFTNWELIIIDDNSQDNGKTEKILKKWAAKDSRIRYIIRSTNFGQHVQPKNEGTKLAKAPLIAYLDDDNSYRRDHLQVLHKYLGDNDVVYGDRMLVNETSVGPKKGALGARSDWDLQKLSMMNYIDTSDVLIRKECIEAIHGWDESLEKYGDWNLWVRLGKAGYKFLHVPLVITDYTVHTGCNSFKEYLEINPLTGKEYPTFEPEACKIVTENETYGKREKKKVAIFTLTMDRFDYTKKMCASMFDTAGYDFDWFVVDNGSKDGTPEWLEKKAGLWCVQIKLNEKNVGISEGSNQALDMIGDEYDLIMKVDNDCEFITNDWLKDFVEVFEAQSKAVISPRVEGLRDSPGGVPRTQYIYIGEEVFGIAPHLGGISVIAPADIYKKFRWETNDFLHGEQDYTFSQFAIKNGYLLLYSEAHIVEHMYGTEGQEKRDPDYWTKRKVEKVTKYEKSV